MGNAIRAEATNVAPRTNVAASRPPITNEVAAKGFQATVIKFSAADLAQAAHRTKNAAKGWKDGSRAPDIASAINMARSLPDVQRWLAEESGLGDRSAQANSPEAITRALYALASQEGPGGLWAQKMVALMNWREDEPAPKREERDTRTISFMDRLQRRRT